MGNLSFTSLKNNDDTLIQKIETARKDTEKKLENSAIAAKYNSQQDQIVINFSDGSEFRFSSRLGQGLQNGTPEQLAEVEVTPSGQGLHWETLDADLSIPDLLRGIYGNRKWMDELKQKKLI